MKITITALFVLLLPLACSGQPLRIVTIDSAGGASAMARDSEGVIHFADQGSIRKGTPAAGTFIGQSESFRSISAMAVAPNGDIFYVADDDNTVRKMSPSGVVTLVAGHAGDEGFANGRGADALFDGPTGITMDSAGNLFVTEDGNDTVRKVRLTGDVTTFVPSDQLFFPQGLTIDSKNNLYVLDSGFNRLRKVTAAGAVTTLASLTDPGDGNAYLPSSVTVDKAGNVYVADTVKSTIKRISPSGAVETVAGVMYSQGGSDGVGSEARFWNIQAILAEPDGSLLIADGGLFRRGLLTVPLPSETVLPAVTISSPVNATRVLDPVLSMNGAASDNAAVSRVEWSLNGSSFQAATGTINWTATLNLIPGVNTIQVRAVDSSGNISTIASRSLTYVVSAPVAIQMKGGGSVTPNYNGQLLEIGKSYTLKIKAAKGFTFTGWTGSLTSTVAALSFVMQPGLKLTANFLDTTKPTVKVLSPKKNAKLSSALVSITGTAADNGTLSAVKCQLNDGAWVTATGTTNWQTVLQLVSGANTIRVFAVDIAGNESAITTISVTTTATGARPSEGVAPVVAPSLSISLEGDAVRLSWPAEATGFSLEFTEMLEPTAVWTKVANAPVAENGQNVVTDKLRGNARFYRLRK